MRENEVLEVLKGIKYGDFEKSIIDLDFVKNISVDGKEIFISLTIPSTDLQLANNLKENIKNAVMKLGFDDVNVKILQPQTHKNPQNITQNEPIKRNLAPNIKHFVMISSTKGGVGKSTTTLNLAISMAALGQKVGLLDADIYGPNIPRMMGIKNQPQINDKNMILPHEKYGLQMVSMGTLIDEEQSLIWRGALLNKALTQLLSDVAWDVDILFIDMPPGTGDVQLSIVQNVPVSCGVCVSTPQNVSVDDTKKTIDMFNKLNIKIAGIIENMSGFICPDNNKEYEIFGKSGAIDFAKSKNINILAQIPIEIDIRKGGDDGMPISFFAPSSISSQRYKKAAFDILNILQNE